MENKNETGDVLKFIDASKELPIAKEFESVAAPYYFVAVEGYGIQKAMFLNKDGENAWYHNYYSKIILPVLAWAI